MANDQLPIANNQLCDLHLHLDGAVRPRTVWDLAREQGHRLPARSVREVARLVRVSKSCRNLTAFLKTFEVFYPLLRTPVAVERIAFELCEDQAKSGVDCFEARFAPVLQAREGFSMEEAVERALAGLRRGCAKFGVEAGLILCCYRSESPASSLRTVRIARRHISNGVVGIDLAGDEIRFPARAHLKAFKLAQRWGIPVTVHAGEAGPASNILEAVLDLGASRIGHGVRLEDDTRTYDLVVKRQIPLEMCLTSNVQTGVVKSYTSHPFARYLRDGVMVTLNSDDPGVSNTTLPREYELARKHLHLSPPELQAIRLNAFVARFSRT
ncbi:MAG: adenosine deaminase [Planctomycetota bacterium]|nr:adenosine deaminase [Planctomycetota bacterium]